MERMDDFQCFRAYSSRNGRVTLSVSCRIDGKGHTIWYEDEMTLAMWAEKLREVSGTDVKISLWRM